MIGITRQKPKILAAHRYIFSVNALAPPLMDQKYPADFQRKRCH